MIRTELSVSGLSLMTPTPLVYIIFYYDTFVINRILL